MIYVKFTGHTPFPNSKYKEYLTFEEDERPQIKHQSIDLAIENARRFRKHLSFTEDDEKNNLIYLEFLQECISTAKYYLITEEEFEQALESL